MTPEEQHAAWKAMVDEHPGFAMLAYSLRFVGGPIPLRVVKAQAKRDRKNAKRLADRQRRRARFLSRYVEGEFAKLYGENRIRVRFNLDGSV